MSKLKYIVMLSFVLVGCGDGSNNNGLGTEFDTQVNGLRIRYDGNWSPRPETIYTWFQQALKCADRVAPERSGITVNPPLVIFVHPGTNDPFDGLTYYKSGTITIESQWTNDKGLWIHEFERWISYSRGVPIENVDYAPELRCQWIT